MIIFSSEQALKNNGERFIKAYHAFYMDHIPKISIQGGLKEIGANKMKIEDPRNVFGDSMEGHLQKILISLLTCHCNKSIITND